MNPELLIPPDSPLRNPPSSLEPVQRVAFDGARFALDMTHIAYQRLYDGLDRLGRSTRGDAKGVADFTLAFVDAWAVVDNLWRLHELTRRFPGLKKSPELEVNLRALAQVEQLRHGFQHAAEKLKKMARDEQPVMGTLTWFWTPDDPLRGGIVMMITAGSLMSTIMPLVNPAGRSFTSPIGLVTLSAFEREIELSSLWARVQKIAHGLDQGARETFGDAPGSGSDLLAASEFEFRSTTADVR
jgi:hypothetical protein